MDVIDRVLAMRTIAVVGCSPRPERPSHYVAEYLLQRGYKIIPVNPAHSEILGQKCYASLSDIPEPVDVVDVFRRSSEALPVIQEAIRIKAKALWLQDGVSHPEGEEAARRSGMLVVSDDCLMRQAARRLQA
ncbi:MAG: CoA-binding protein [Elusimicrobia bacterium]|nr:CoA-binding protein [Elusimicrobiota bacterium]